MNLGSLTDLVFLIWIKLLFIFTIHSLLIKWESFYTEIDPTETNLTFDSSGKLSQAWHGCLQHGCPHLTGVFCFASVFTNCKNHSKIIIVQINLCSILYTSCTPPSHCWAIASSIPSKRSGSPLPAIVNDCLFSCEFTGPRDLKRERADTLLRVRRLQWSHVWQVLVSSMPGHNDDDFLLRGRQTPIK